MAKPVLIVRAPDRYTIAERQALWMRAEHALHEEYHVIIVPTPGDWTFELFSVFGAVEVDFKELKQKLMGDNG